MPFWAEIVVSCVKRQNTGWHRNCAGITVSCYETKHHIQTRRLTNDKYLHHVRTKSTRTDTLVFLQRGMDGWMDDRPIASKKEMPVELFLSCLFIIHYRCVSCTFSRTVLAVPVSPFVSPSTRPLLLQWEANILLNVTQK